MKIKIGDKVLAYVITYECDYREATVLRIIKLEEKRKYLVEYDYDFLFFFKTKAHEWISDDDIALEEK